MHKEAEKMKELRSKFCMFVNLLQEKYQGFLTDNIAQSKDESKRFHKYPILLYIYHLM